MNNLNSALDALAAESKTLPGRENWEMEVPANVVAALVALAKEMVDNTCSECHHLYPERQTLMDQLAAALGVQA